jgi:hypothetical protein
MGDRLYEGMNIQGTTGLMIAQKSTRRALGALTESYISIGVGRASPVENRLNFPVEQLQVTFATPAISLASSLQRQLCKPIAPHRGLVGA